MLINKLVFFILLFSFNLSFAEDKKDDIYPIMSNMLLEQNIAEVLKNELNLPIKLEVVNDNKDDLRVSVYFKGDNTKGVSSVAVFINTKILKKSDNGKVLSQIVSFFSISNIKLKNEEKLYKLVNTWNNKTLPLKMHIINNKLYVSRNILITTDVPLTKNNIIQTFKNIVQVWPVLIQDLKRNNLLE